MVALFITMLVEIFMIERDVWNQRILH